MGNPEITSITSSGDRMDAADHELNLDAVLSHPQTLYAVADGLTSDEKYYILKRLNYESLVNLDDLPVSAAFMLEKIHSLDIKESIEILKEYLVDHKGDVNIPSADYDFVAKLVEERPAHTKELNEKISGEKNEVFVEAESVSDASTNSLGVDAAKWDLQVKTEAGMIAYHSPYPEVRAVTDPYDDPSIPCETFRVYLLGIIWTCIGTFFNQFFSERYPGISLDTAVVQLLLYPSGLLVARILPKWSFKVWRYTIDLNPGPWNHKEQMLTTIFYSVSAGTAYVSWNIHVLKMPMFYDVKWAKWGYQILLILCSQFMGFGFAGILRKFAVYPIKSIWPTLLPTLALNKALMQREAKESIHGWKISRYNFFFVCFISSFVYFWIPDYLFSALSTFNWMTWIAPNNFNLAMITGSLGGMGVNPITTFDWNIINFNMALTLPFYSQLNQYIGTVLAFFCITAVWYSNYKWTGFLPINSNTLYTNTGDNYAVTEVLNSNSLLDQAKYDVYGPPFYTAGNLVVYGAFFALYPFTIVYVFALNYKTMWKAMKGLIVSIKNIRRSTFEGFKDPFTRSMTKYKEVPDWIFLVVLLISVVLAILCLKCYPTNTPVWGIFFALGMNFVFLIPLTLVYSVTGFSFGLNVLVELIVGYAIPGNGLALNFIKAIGYNIDGQAQNYITDQKMGHYMRIPPRAIFRTQMLSVFISSFVGLATLNFTIGNISDYCAADQKQKFTCPDAKTFYSASVLWGVIGPKKVFDGLYPVLKWCFLIGFLLAFPCIAIKKYGTKKFTILKYFEPVLIIGGFLNWAPYNLSFITPGFIASFFFMHLIRKRYLTWWEKYNYILSGGLTSGVAFSSIIIFFAVQYHEKDVSWWGNNVPFLGLDALSPSRLVAADSAPDGYFGPRIGNFP